MKQIIVLASCMLIFSAAYAQKTASTAKGTSVVKTKAPIKKFPTVGGIIRDAHKHPIPGVKAFAYAPDSTISASGYSDSAGHYETNALAPGTYNLKLVYPSDKITRIAGVVVKRGITEININMDEPVEDTTLSWADFAPKVPAKKVKKSAK